MEHNESMQHNQFNIFKIHNRNNLSNNIQVKVHGVIVNTNPNGNNHFRIESIFPEIGFGDCLYWEYSIDLSTASQTNNAQGFQLISNGQVELFLGNNHLLSMNQIHVFSQTRNNAHLQAVNSENYTQNQYNKILYNNKTSSIAAQAQPTDTNGLQLTTPTLAYLSEEKIDFEKPGTHGLQDEYVSSTAQKCSEDHYFKIFKYHNDRALRSTIQVKILSFSTRYY